MTYTRFLPFAAIALIWLVACLLYIPFLNNGLVFDDHALFSTLRVYDYAEIPFNMGLRTFPYFTLGFIQVQFGDIATQRVLNLVIHILCALMLFRLLKSLLTDALVPMPASASAASIVASSGSMLTKAYVVAFIGGAWFAVHPVATYGVGYLVQRTILFSTLFSLLCLWFYHRSLRRQRTMDAITAAFFYSLAVLSKEHAIMLPAAAVVLNALFPHDLRANAKRAAVFLLFCIPAGINTLLASRSVIANSYEPQVEPILMVIQGLALLEYGWGQWLVSAVLQSGFFFDYLGYWWIPDVRSMSIDMRVDFAQLWNAWRLIPKAILFLLCPAIAFYCLRRGGALRLFGVGLMYSWFLFFTELVTVRFQEPFVLYRSYIWAPGYILMLAALACFLSVRRAMIAGVFFLAGGVLLAHERLESLESELSAWNDAAAKIESTEVPGAARIFFMRGRNYMKEKQFDQAIADFTISEQQHPSASEIFYHRGLAYFGLKKFETALEDFDRAVKLNRTYGAAHYARGAALEALGCLDAAYAAVEQSEELDFKIASMKLKYLEKNLADRVNSMSARCVGLAKNAT